LKNSDSGASTRMVWGLAAAAAVLTAAVLMGSSKRLELLPEEVSADVPGSGLPVPAAQVGDGVLYVEDMLLLDLDGRDLREWVEDQLLAELARKRGIGNSAECRVIRERAEQQYFKERMLDHVYSGIPLPDSAAVMAVMRGDSQVYLVERHYWQIVVGDSATADSIYGRLDRGDNFQVTATRLSMGQKAGLGGDLGFLTAGELMAYGMSRESVLLDGLGGPVRTPYGWHILMVTETRGLEDTQRVVRSVADDIRRDRMAAARDSLLRVARGEMEVFVDDSALKMEGAAVGTDTVNSGGEMQ